MKSTFLFVLLIFSTSTFSQSRDPRSYDRANVFWDGEYPLYSLSSNQEIKPGSNGYYNFWGTTNENPEPAYYSIRKGSQLMVYKFINYEECLSYCNVIRASKGMNLISQNTNSESDKPIWSHTNGSFYKTEYYSSNNISKWFENDGQFQYEENSNNGSEIILKDINRQGVYIKLTNSACYYKDNNSTNWILIYYGKWSVLPNSFTQQNKNSTSQTTTTTNNTTTTQTSNTNNKVESTSSCQLKFSRITGMTYSFTDNREKCCFCEKSYAKYSLNNSYQKDEEILLIGELLYLHLHNESEEHKKNDIERCQKFISDNFGAISGLSFQIGFSLMQLHFYESTMNGGNFGQKHRKVNKYNFENKFCTNECESKCKYYGCSCK